MDSVVLPQHLANSFIVRPLSLPTLRLPAPISFSGQHFRQGTLPYNQIPRYHLWTHLMRTSISYFWPMTDTWSLMALCLPVLPERIPRGSLHCFWRERGGKISRTKIRYRMRVFLLDMMLLDHVYRRTFQAEPRLSNFIVCYFQSQDSHSKSA